MSIFSNVYACGKILIREFQRQVWDEVIKFKNDLTQNIPV